MFWVAWPGNSEYQTGLAADIVEQNDQLPAKKQEVTPVQQWHRPTARNTAFFSALPCREKGRAPASVMSPLPQYGSQCRQGDYPAFY